MRPARTHCATVLVAGIALLAAPAHAAPERGLNTTIGSDAPDLPKDRLYYTNASFARVNPLGLQNVFKLGWRHRLIDAPADSLLFNDTYTYVAFDSLVTPAFTRLGAHFEFSPIALWKAWGGVSAVGHYGTFDQVASYPTPDVEFSESAMDGTSDPRLGWLVTAGTVLQAKVGPVAIRSTFQVVRFDMDLPEGNEWFYDLTWDRLMPNRGLVAVNDFDVLVFAGKVRVGARWTWNNDFDTRNDSFDSGVAHHRVGPLFAYQFRPAVTGERFTEPTFFMLAQWWLSHPYRTGPLDTGLLDGTLSNQLMPLIAAGFSFKGDFWTSNGTVAAGPDVAEQAREAAEAEAAPEEPETAPEEPETAPEEPETAPEEAETAPEGTD